MNSSKENEEVVNGAHDGQKGEVLFYIPLEEDEEAQQEAPSGALFYIPLEEDEDPEEKTPSETDAGSHGSNDCISDG